MRLRASLFIILLAVSPGPAPEPARADVGRWALTANHTAPPPPANAPDVVTYAGGAIDVEFDATQFPRLTRNDLLAWVRESARATATYFGRFPMSHVRLVIRPTSGAEVTMGFALADPEPRIVVRMGRETSAAELALESLLVHEMTHLAVPDHDLRYLWLHEGIATYVEHIARAQAGLLSPAAMWHELIRELPSGLPEPSDNGGLDATESEARRYWGGALFCLLADIEIRRATDNRQGLQDALRALQRQGGNLSTMWTLERTLDVANQATGTTALTLLYQLMGNRPHRPSLEQIWRDLGITRTSHGVVLDDRAPLASIRRAITDRRSSRPLLVKKPRLMRVVSARAVRATR
jgi:hypothetical protein